MPWNVAIAGFGVTAAILLVGGAVVLRYQRDRYHFLLMQGALEKGQPAMAEAVPGWLISMRIGVLALVLGLGLLASGVVVYQSAQWVEVPAIEAGVAPAPPQGPAADRPGEPRPGRENPPAPPRPQPALERWHRVEERHQVGLVGGSIGAIVALLGIVRILFARLERRYGASVATRAT